MVGDGRAKSTTHVSFHGIRQRLPSDSKETYQQPTSNIFHEFQRSKARRRGVQPTPPRGAETLTLTCYYYLQYLGTYYYY